MLSKDIREYAIDVQNASHRDRQKMCTLLEKRGEEIYSSTLIRDRDIGAYAYFIYSGDGTWCLSTKVRRNVINISKFIRMLEPKKIVGGELL